MLLVITTINMEMQLLTHACSVLWPVACLPDPLAELMVYFVLLTCFKALRFITAAESRTAFCPAHSSAPVHVLVMQHTGLQKWLLLD